MRGVIAKFLRAFLAPARADDYLWLALFVEKGDQPVTHVQKARQQ